MKDFYFISSLREAGDISSNEEVSAGEERGLEAGGDPGGWEVSLCFFFLFFSVDHFKVFMEFITVLLLFYVLVFWP